MNDGNDEADKKLVLSDDSESKSIGYVELRRSCTLNFFNEFFSIQTQRGYKEKDKINNKKKKEIEDKLFKKRNKESAKQKKTRMKERKEKKKDTQNKNENHKIQNEVAFIPKKSKSKLHLIRFHSSNTH